jgi:xylulokinase
MTTAGPVLAIDLGTGGPKVALVTLDGEVLGREFESTPLNVLPGGGVEQSPDDWWGAVATAARRLADRGLAKPEDVEAVMVTGQWGGTVPVSADNTPLTDGLSWMDARGAPHTRAIAGGPVAGYHPSKVMRWVRLTGGAPSLSGRDPLGHILWFKNERPDIYAETATFLEPVDYLGMRITGRRATSNTTATYLWLTDARDLSKPRYDDGLIEMAGVDRSKLPELLPAGAVLGNVTEEASRELGVGTQAKVIVGVPDSMSAAVGSGAVEDFAAHLYVGTSSWLSCHVPFKRTDPLHAVASLPSAIPNRYLVSCEQQTAGKCLELARDTLLPGSGDDGYPELLEMAAAAPVGSGGVVYAPWLNGERTPVDDHLVRGGFYNLTLDTTREQLARAVLEGVALNTRWMHKYVERLSRKKLSPITYIGGGARSELWCQIMADVLGRPIRQVANPIEANVLGTGFLAGLSLGKLQLSDIPRRVKIEATFEPDPAAHRTYTELFDVLRKIYKANKRIYAKLNANHSGGS